MEILRPVGVAVVVPVVTDPPQRPVLARKNATKSEHELELAAGLERSVRQQAVIPRCYAK
jgi:hypothetical protein